MYNALTGRNEKVGNWAGVTVSSKEHGVRSKYSGGLKITAVDLPGAYSMSPFTGEESITSSYVKNESPDVIINIVDATNLGRSLFFTTQLLELGIIELPQYKLPSLIGAFKSMCQRGWSYIAKAATIILLCNMAVQLMQSFTWSFSIAESADSSILASIATPFAYILAPVVGVVSWQLAAAAVTGFIAKENVVGTLAVCFAGLESLIDADELVLMEGAGAEAAVVMGLTKAAALAYLIFNLYTPPCFAAIGAMNSEMKSAKWLWGGIGLQLGVGYTVAYFVYTIGTLLSGGGLNPAMAAGGLFVVILFIAVTAGIAIRSRRAGAEERAAA